MDAIIVSDACRRIEEEIQRLRMVLASLTAERDELRCHICPELEARYAQAVGDLQIRIHLQEILIQEFRISIELARAALNREKVISREEIEDQVRRRYQTFHDRVGEERRKAERAKREQKERERRQRQYERAWRDRYGGDAGKEASREDGHAKGKAGRMPDAKELYRKLVKRLHPDMNPDGTEREKELFRRAVKAYQEGDIATLQEVYDEVFGDETAADTGWKARSYEELTALRDRLKEQIRLLQEEIRAIRESFPYSMKEMLDDPAAVAAKREELQRQISRNDEALKRLDGISKEIVREMEALRKKKGGADG